MPFVVTRERLVSLRVGAVVNPASPSLAAMDGVSAEIFNAAGQRRLGAACRRIGYCETGRAVLTRGYGLRAKYIIHTVGPIWRSGDEIEPLASAYRSALDLALERDCGSVAIPLLSVGKYGCPSEVSLKIACQVICTFLEEHDLTILLVLPEESGPVLEDELFRAVQSYVDEHFRPGGTTAPTACPASSPMAAATDLFPPLSQAAASGGRRALADVLRNLDESFSRMLLRLIDEKGYTDAEVYKRANMDRKLFSKLRRDGYVPSKPTVLTLAIALRLNLDETHDFLARAGYALSPGSKSDVIVEYFISQGSFDLFEINEALFAFDQKPLGV